MTTITESQQAAQTLKEYNDRIREIQDYDDAQQSERMQIYDKLAREVFDNLVNIDTLRRNC